MEVLHLKKNNYAIDVRYSKMENGNVIQIYQCNGTNAQKFFCKDRENGYKSIHSAINQKFCIDVQYSQTKNFTKIIGTFEPVIYSSNFIQEVEHLGFLAKYNALNEEGNLDNIREDYQILFNGSFLLDDTIPIKSSSIKTMYYLTKNFGSVFYVFFDYLTEECEDKFTSYSDKTKKI